MRSAVKDLLKISCLLGHVVWMPAKTGIDLCNTAYTRMVTLNNEVIPHNMDEPYYNYKG